MTRKINSRKTLETLQFPIFQVILSSLYYQIRFEAYTQSAAAVLGAIS